MVGGRKLKPAQLRVKGIKLDTSLYWVRWRGVQLHTARIKRLSAMDISALASMKSAAKCDTWCELQNPANHREFERKLRLRPSGQGHVRLGVKRYVAPCQLHPTLRVCMREGRMCRVARRGRPAGTTDLRAGDRLVGHEQQGVDEKCACVASWRPEKRLYLTNDPSPSVGRWTSAWNATPGWARPPAEFKHINKRRRRNLQGFP